MDNIGHQRLPRRPVLRRQLRAHSPIPTAAPAAAALAALGIAGDPREWLARHLLETYGARAAALCGSGTDALRVAIDIVNREAGGNATVALPAFSCYDIATAAIGADVRIHLYDLDPATLGPDWDSLGAALHLGARIVVAAPLYGFPIDWQTLDAVAGAAGAIVIEDAAQGDGACWRARALGTLGELSILSFARGKGWTAFRGGALLGRGRWAAAVEEYRVAPAGRELAIAAGAAVQLLLGRPSLYGLPAAIPWLGLGETRYREPAAYPAAMTRAAAATLRASRTAATAERAVRAANARFLVDALHAAAADPVEPVDGAAPGYLRLPVLVPESHAARLAGDPVATALGVAPSYPAPLTRLAPVRVRMVGPAPVSGADLLARRLFTAPTHGLLRHRDLLGIVRVLGADDGAGAPYRADHVAHVQQSSADEAEREPARPA